MSSASEDSRTSFAIFNWVAVFAWTEMRISPPGDPVFIMLCSGFGNSYADQCSANSDHSGPSRYRAQTGKQRTGCNQPAHSPNCQRTDARQEFQRLSQYVPRQRFLPSISRERLSEILVGNQSGNVII